MDMFNKPHCRLFYFFGIIILVGTSMVSHLIYATYQQKQALTTLLSYMDTSIYFLGTKVDDYLEQLHYDYTLFKNQEAFITLDSATLTSTIGEFMFYHPSISNIYIIDSNDTLLYGVNNNHLMITPYSAHIERALQGDRDFYLTYYNNQPFIQVAYPFITNNEYTTALISTYHFDELTHFFKDFTTSLENINLYLFDSQGMLITSSHQTLKTNTSSTIPINLICSGIDYAPNESLNFMNENNVYGRYHKIETLEWTILITGTYQSDFKLPLFLSITSICLGIFSITLLFYMREKHLLIAQYKINSDLKVNSKHT